MNYELWQMGLSEAHTWTLAWLDGWPRAKEVTLEVEEIVRLSALPWAEAWTLAEATVRAERAWAKEACSALSSPWSALEANLGRRVAKEVKGDLGDLGGNVEELERRRWDAEILARALARVWGWARSEARARGESVPPGLAHPSTIQLVLTSLSRSGIANHLWHNSPETRDEYSCIVHFISPITRLPFELLRQIFLIIVENMSDPPLALMLVCRHWHAIVTGIWASLTLTTRTPIDAVTSKLERSRWLLDIVVDTDSDRGDFIPSDGTFDAIFAAMEASSRWRSLVIESFPPLTDLREDLVNRSLQQRSKTTMSRFTMFKIKSACETSPLLDSLLRMLGIAASAELTTVEINSPYVISSLVSGYPSIFHSVKVLSLDTPGIHNPVDLLPHLHHLESFTASHISFPIYHSDVGLPLIHTLRHLNLKAASIQWMSGRTFYILEHCSLIFPLHRQVLHTFSATLPNCKHLTFQGVPLDILNNISADKLTDLSVTCCSSFNRRGDRQLVWLSQVFRESRLAPNILHIGIGAAHQTWIYALAFMPGLEELVFQCARPSSLGAKVLWELVALPIDSNTLGAPLCPLLRRFGLRYDRWLRSNEEFDLIPAIMSIIGSRYFSKRPLESFGLCLWSTQMVPVELIEQSDMSPNGFIYLAYQSGIGVSSVQAIAEDMARKPFADRFRRPIHHHHNVSAPFPHRKNSGRQEEGRSMP